MQSAWKHFVDILKAALAIALINAIVAFFNYMGAHIGELQTLAASLGGGFAAIKARIT